MSTCKDCGQDFSTHAMSKCIDSLRAQRDEARERYEAAEALLVALDKPGVELLRIAERQRDIAVEALRELIVRRGFVASSDEGYARNALAAIEEVKP